MSIEAHQNISMPPLMYGTAWKEERTADLVEMAVKSGFRGIDTACQPKHYNEAGVGEALRRLFEQGFSRNELFIQTKFTPLSGQDPQRIPYDPRAELEIQVVQSYQRSLDNLGVEFINSLVLHSPLFPYSQLIRVWNAMEESVSHGGVGQIGISNCYDLELLQRLYRDATIKPSVVQNRFYQESDYDKELREWCNEMGIRYQSFWSLTANPHILRNEIIITLGEKYSQTPAQIWYRYLHQCNIVPLIGSTSQHHINEDLRIFDFTLSDDEVETITSLL
ncbi:MAG: aldo/keto reductase [Sulfuricurvum sp.]|uniref:aldo/keto reductase family protein n=1 Tax=Sulfuricurvum sp. TaxID=2025608 RepID=UPI00260A4452|nr:aldo/keto reductase [Sulfuricurvum sp.]MDD2830437.1 aldo/keto reductase [Sulfuricurvum sp.]MDD4950031.1 aldo/keto reductase [Sulfuricurvum sp.]